ncbi:MAG: hypothetical protein F6K61_15110 [Sphaerospermopsis sp. SIO1G1]|nr:hypothetical protein [Sphaerospermopsis sp. SIO1G1]
MSMIRKPTVSTKSSWFNRNPISAVAKKKSERLSVSQTETFKESRRSSVVRPKAKSQSTHTLSDSQVNQSVLPNLDQHTYEAQVTKTSQKSLPDLPVNSQTGHIPSWLLRLHSVYRYSSGIAFCLVTATLVVYGWTVYSQEIWGKHYSTLKGLQRHERQLNTTNAALTSKMAKEGEAAGKSLVTPNSRKTIFLNSTYKSSNTQSTNTTPNSENQIPTSSSLGY